MSSFIFPFVLSLQHNSVELCLLFNGAACFNWQNHSGVNCTDVPAVCTSMNEYKQIFVTAFCLLFILLFIYFIY